MFQVVFLSCLISSLPAVAAVAPSHRQGHSVSDSGDVDVAVEGVVVPAGLELKGQKKKWLQNMINI